MAPKRKTLQIAHFKSEDNCLDTSNRWKKWFREFTTLMEYYEITDAAEKKLCLLAHGGEEILDINDNVTDAEVAEENDVYKKLVLKIKKYL